jgi:hypothetical protein
VKEQAVWQSTLRNSRGIVPDGPVLHKVRVHAQEIEQIYDDLGRILLEFFKNTDLDLISCRDIELSFHPLVVESLLQMTRFRR